MESLLQGKLFRTEGVVGAFYSPIIEDFFEDVSEGVETDLLFPDQVNTELYDVSVDIMRDLNLNTGTTDALRREENRVNLHFLRKPGLGTSGPFDSPIDALHKWYPEDSNSRDLWLDYVQEQGFEPEDPPPPPGIVVDAPGRYSNTALQNVVASARSVAQNIYDEFIRPVELEFEVNIETRD